MSSKPHLQGDSIDCEGWLEAHGDYLFRFAMLRTRNREISEDLVQDTLLAALKARASFEGRSSVRTWLVGILKNKIIDHFRSASRYSEESTAIRDIDDILMKRFNRLGIWIGILDDWASNPEAQLKNKQFIQQVEECLSKLTEVQRRVFVQKVLDGMSQEEVCKDVGINPSNLWVITYRARMSLRECIEATWVKGSEGRK